MKYALGYAFRFVGFIGESLALASLSLLFSVVGVQGQTVSSQLEHGGGISKPVANENRVGIAQVNHVLSHGPVGYGVIQGNTIGYDGGPVMLGPHNVYLIWYGNWNNNTATTILPQFISGLNRSLYFNTNISYGEIVTDGSGDGQMVSEGNIANTVTLGGQIFDSYSQGSTLSQSQVYNVVARALSNGLPSDGNGIYFVLTSADVTASNNQGGVFCGTNPNKDFCAYHTYGTFSNSALLKFAFVGNPARCLSTCAASNIGVGPNGNPGADGMTNLMAHELNETVTDPLLDAWLDGSLQGEVGDLCNFNFGSEFSAPNGAPANVVLGGRYFLIQQNFINAQGGHCGMSYGANGTQGTGTVAFTGTIPCNEGQGCDQGTVQLTVGPTTEVVNYDGSGTYGDSNVQAIANDLANLFNNDPNSPVTAVASAPSFGLGSGNPDWWIIFTAKQSGSATNYGISGSINSFVGIPSDFAVTSNPTLTGGTDSCCN